MNPRKEWMKNHANACLIYWTSFRTKHLFCLFRIIENGQSAWTDCCICHRFKIKIINKFKKNKANSKKIYYFGKDIENHNDCGSRLVFMRFVSYSRYWNHHFLKLCKNKASAHVPFGAWVVCAYCIAGLWWSSVVVSAAPIAPFCFVAFGIRVETFRRFHE